jgi:hypothetical protein
MMATAAVLSVTHLFGEDDRPAEELTVNDIPSFKERCATMDAKAAAAEAAAEASQATRSWWQFWH